MTVHIKGVAVSDELADYLWPLQFINCEGIGGHYNKVSENIFYHWRTNWCMLKLH